ncbi:phosphotransferase enzyme family protein [Bacillus sp. 123MFChir2]|uniref:phosphotransferase enzyme family protein n=1 Tax=Bacillus sp. 123MFChir2 TaxID=1169144 RepID=UPI00037D688E|nr:phosphotransferase [Bacillus sp. 123MFChir2]
MSEKVKQAMQYFRGKEESCVKLSSGFQNEVYEYTYEGERRILRITPSSRRSLKQIQSELDFIYSLQAGGVNVSLPVASCFGNGVEQIDIEEEAFFITSFIKAPGQFVNVTNDEEWNERLFQNWGQTIGKMHAIAKKNAHDYETYERPIWKYDIKSMNFLKSISTTLAANYEKMISEVQELPKEQDTYGLIHNDLHQGNLFVKDNTITIFDFDDCSFNWFAQDIAATFYHAVWQGLSVRPEHVSFPQEFMKHFIEGYNKEHTMSKEILRQIPLFLKLREVFLFMLFHNVWDAKNLEDWQAHTLQDLQQRIEHEIPYTNVDFLTFV